MLLRELRATDAETVATLWRACAAESGLVDAVFRPRACAAVYGERLAAQLEAAEILGWGAFTAVETAPMLIGYLTAEVRRASIDWEQDDILYILDVDVEPDFRGRGVAKNLVQLALAKAAALRIFRAELSWIANDPRATEVWTRLGFRPYLTRGWITFDPGGEPA